MKLSFKLMILPTRLTNRQKINKIMVFNKFKDKKDTRKATEDRSEKFCTKNI